MHIIANTLPILIMAVLMMSTPLLALGVDDTFTVTTVYGDDSVPPSVPASLTATPIASSQINLAWSTSTDNLLLSGYQVFRDGIQIATTTAPQYVDVGLLPETLYAYYVTAFDASNNVSASSTEVATTTLASSSPPSVSEDVSVRSVQGTLIRPYEIILLEIIPGKDSVIIRYETKGYTRAIIRWGRTASYELGAAAERSFSRTHETVITGLSPWTTYLYTIESEDSAGRIERSKQGTFKTLPPDDVYPPQNVSGLRATLDGADVVLSWENPPDLDFSKVRVLASDRFYPSDAVDSILIYEGSGESVRDAGIALAGTRRYYTIFSYDELGNISSGAVVSVVIRSPTPLETGGLETESSTPIMEIVDPVVETHLPTILEFKDFKFFQDGVEVYPLETTVVIDGGKSLIVELPYDRVPEHLKTITITINDGIEKYSFLLRINKERTAYVSTLSPIGREGIFPITLALYDYQTAQIGYAHGTLSSMITGTAVSDGGSIGARLVEVLMGRTGVALLSGVALFFLLMFLVRRFREKGDVENV